MTKCIYINILSSYPHTYRRLVLAELEQYQLQSRLNALSTELGRIHTWPIEERVVR
jgi:hypothetical protein